MNEINVSIMIQAIHVNVKTWEFETLQDREMRKHGNLKPYNTGK